MMRTTTTTLLMHTTLIKRCVWCSVDVYSQPMMSTTTTTTTTLLMLTTLIKRCVWCSIDVYPPVNLFSHTFSWSV